MRTVSLLGFLVDSSHQAVVASKISAMSLISSLPHVKGGHIVKLGDYLSCLLQFQKIARPLYAVEFIYY